MNKKKRVSKDRLKKKREAEKIEHNKWFNNFKKQFNKEPTLWEKIKIYFSNLIK